MSSPLRIDELPLGVRVLTLEAPARRNALSPELIEALIAAFDPAACRRARAIWLRSSSEAFCSGYDLGAFPPQTSDGPLPDDRLGELMTLVREHPLPVVAEVGGAAFGAGFELCASCDFRVGSPSARLCLPPANLGIVYAAAGMARLYALVGPAKARRLFLFAQTLSGDEAFAWGLFDELCPQDQLQARAGALCQALAEKAPLALFGMKKTLVAFERSLQATVPHLELRELRRQAFASEDAKEGLAALAQRRKPDFKGSA